MYLGLCNKLHYYYNYYNMTMRCTGHFEFIYISHLLLTRSLVSHNNLGYTIREKYVFLHFLFYINSRSHCIQLWDVGLHITHYAFYYYYCFIRHLHTCFVVGILQRCCLQMHTLWWFHFPPSASQILCVLLFSDAFFWIGFTEHPSPQGIIVPNDKGS